MKEDEWRWKKMEVDGGRWKKINEDGGRRKMRTMEEDEGRKEEEGR
jgi:hypothetical protein